VAFVNLHLCVGLQSGGLQRTRNAEDLATVTLMSVAPPVVGLRSDALTFFCSRLWLSLSHCIMNAWQTLAQRKSLPILCASIV
jgi:hypothetical protein